MAQPEISADCEPAVNRKEPSKAQQRRNGSNRYPRENCSKHHHKEVVQQLFVLPRFDGRSAVCSAFHANTHTSVSLLIGSVPRLCETSRFSGGWCGAAEDARPLVSGGHRTAHDPSQEIAQAFEWPAKNGGLGGPTQGRHRQRRAAGTDRGSR